MLRNFLMLLGIVLTLWGCHCPPIVSNDELRGQEIRAYTGLLRNFSASAVSIPSQNSDATLILPPGGEMEYTVWQPKFAISGYINRTQVYYKNITIGPATKFTFLGRTYDFLAEVCPDLPAPMILPQQCPPPRRIEPEPCVNPRSPRRVCPG